MWLLESDKTFAGRRLWLRPGKTYLLGRPRLEADPGQLMISDATISRKHLTITVDRVADGASQDVSIRTGVVIEDLNTKLGTRIGNQWIKGSKYVVSGDQVSMTLAKCQEIVRLRWIPVVFTFSLTKKELQAQPMQSLRERFEQLDIKLLLDYDTRWTTHVFSKKRNTAKGLQALANGKHIVAESFLDAVFAVTEIDKGEPSGSCPLELDFDKHWPDAMEHLPPRGNEAVQYPDDIYRPDPERSSVFEGYTFIFYNQSQYQTLLAPITCGSGKALLRDVEANKTTVEDFVRYVKQVAGEKGLGSFDDGSEGRGVVLVRYLPPDGSLVGWYTDFLTNVSLRLDHRPIEQNEFLEAILIKDASKLRRPLEVESSMGDSLTQRREQTLPEPASLQPNYAADPGQPVASPQEPAPESQPVPAARRVGFRRPVVKRFVGFEDSDVEDVNMDDIPAAPAAAPSQSNQRPDVEEGLFVSQEPDVLSEDSTSRARTQRTQRTQRKRTAEPIPEHDLMDGIAPAVAKFKRQKLDEAFAPPSPEPEPEPERETDESAQRVKGKKAREELNVLAMAAKNREEAEARARAEQEDLAHLPEGIDLAEIRRLNIVEEMEMRSPGAGAAAGRSRSRDDDVSSGRWNPKWNGVKNFKKFQRRGEVTGRQPARVIVPLTEVKNKEFGVGDNYWLEDRETRKARRAEERAARRGQTPQVAAAAAATLRGGRPLQNGRVASATSDGDEDEGSNLVVDGDENDDEDAQGRPSSDRLAVRRNGRGEAHAHAQGHSTGKRAAARSGERDGPPAKRPRQAARALEMSDDDDDDSDDELKFRFGQRR